MAWDVWNTEEFEDWYMSLDAADTAAVDDAVAMLEQEGPTLGRPLVDHVKGTRRHHNMKELRPPATALRVLFAFDPRRNAVLLLGWDKTGTWSASYPKKVQAAERLLDEWLDDL